MLFLRRRGKGKARKEGKRELICMIVFVKLIALKKGKRGLQ